jgi:parallel beta-helix repeat protein
MSHPVVRRVPALSVSLASLLVLLAAGGGVGAPLRTLWVDHESRGGPCSDGYSAVDNAAASPPGSKPWCTLAAAAKVVRAGDLVSVRGGTYKELMTCFNPGCAGMCVLELIKKGTAQNPITYRSYAGETPIIDPAGQIPKLSAPNGLVAGLCAGITPPVGLCKGGSRAGQDCTTDDGDASTGCPGAACPNCCDRSPSYQTIVDGFKFQNWSYYDTNADASNTSHVPSQYAALITWGLGPATNITIRNSEFTNNNGGGVLHAHGTGRITFEYNKVHDNWTHGWTSAVNFWNGVGKNEGANVIRGNVVWNNQDDPPVWCLPKYCGGATSNKNACAWDQYTNTHLSTPQGYGCACGTNADCQSNKCVARDCSAAKGGCECAGDTEGHGIILDIAKGTCSFSSQPTTNCGWLQDPVCDGGCTGSGKPYACCTGKGAGNCCNQGDAGNFLIESNVFYNNEGNCIDLFKSGGGTVRNNTCYRNQRRPSGGEITAFTNQSSFYNNVVVPRGERTCWQSTNQGVDCTSDASVCQGGVCADKWALALYSSSGIFPITPTTNSEGYNILWSPTTQDIVQYAGGSIGTVAEFVNAMKPQYGYGVQDLQTDPMLVNPGGNPPDFRLKAGSPAAGSGDPAHLAPADVTGAARSGPDRGAYAQGSGAPPTTTTTLPQTGSPAPPKLLSVEPQ